MGGKKLRASIGGEEAGGEAATPEDENVGGDAAKRPDYLLIHDVRYFLSFCVSCDS